MKLYELATAYSELYNMEDEGAAITDTLEAIQGAVEEKAQNIGYLLRSWASDINAIDAEIERLQARQKAIENKMSRTKKYLEQQMDAMGIDKIKTPTITLWIQPNHPAVEIDNESAVPATYLRIIPAQRQPDKIRIREALEAGENVPGARLVQGRGLRIR